MTSEAPFNCRAVDQSVAYLKASLPSTSIAISVDQECSHAARSAREVPARGSDSFENKNTYPAEVSPFPTMIFGGL